MLLVVLQVHGTLKIKRKRAKRPDIFLQILQVRFRQDL